MFNITSGTMSVASCLAAQFQTFYDIICQVNKRTDNRKLQLQIFHNKKPLSSFLIGFQPLSIRILPWEPEVFKDKSHEVRSGEERENRQEVRKPLVARDS